MFELEEIILSTKSWSFKIKKYLMKNRDIFPNFWFLRLNCKSWAIWTCCANQMVYHMMSCEHYHHVSNLTQKIDRETIEVEEKEIDQDASWCIVMQDSDTSYHKHNKIILLRRLVVCSILSKDTLIYWHETWHTY